MERIESLRRAELDHVHCYDEFFYLFYKRYDESTLGSEYERYADAFYYAFSHLTPMITDGELIVGELRGSLSGKAREEWESRYRDICIERFRLAGGGQDSHMAID